MKRIHDGAIGELVGGQCYWYGERHLVQGRSEDSQMSELEWQCHNWYHFAWLSGDQICEQHIHNIDVMNWCFNGPPAKFTAVGGRQWRSSNADQVKTAKEVCRKFNNGSEDELGEIQRRHLGPHLRRVRVCQRRPLPEFQRPQPRHRTQRREDRRHQGHQQLQRQHHGRRTPGPSRAEASIRWCRSTRT